MTFFLLSESFLMYFLQVNFFFSLITPNSNYRFVDYRFTSISLLKKSPTLVVTTFQMLIYKPKEPK
jgi:hypothetical protein